MGILNDWIDSELSNISHDCDIDNDIFNAGFTSGYEKALLNLEIFMDDIKSFPPEFKKIYNQGRREIF